MSSSFQYNVLAGFRAISELQATITRNAQGLLKPGYNHQTLHLGQSGGGGSTDAQNPTVGSGGRNSMGGGGDTLSITGTSLSFTQGMIDPAFSPTSLAIRGEGFFILAENLQPGARLFLSRAGDFHYDREGRLVNPQGLFVVGGNGTVTDPVTPVVNPGDGTVDLRQVTLGKVPAPSQLGISGYGDTTYAITGSSGPLKGFANGRPEVGFVQADSIEIPDRTGAAAEISTEVITALQTYKIFKEVLDNFNKSTDDALNLVK